MIKVIAGMPKNPDEYDPDRAGAWAAVMATQGPPPPARADSTVARCDNCGIEIWLGPMQAAGAAVWEATDTDYHTICIVCAGQLLGGAPDGLVSVVALEED